MWEAARLAALAISLEAGANDRAAADEERRRQCDLLRDIFPNPFQVIDYDWARAAKNRDVCNLAEMMYEARNFEDFPILADALQEIGYANTIILGHCRTKAEHVRGCWVLDSILKKT
jgi:hypothetical protein